MIINYDNFLILERLFNLDDDLKTILNKIAYKSTIAKDLLELKELPDDFKWSVNDLNLDKSGQFKLTTDKHNINVKIGTFINTLKNELKLSYKDWEIEKFVNLIKLNVAEYFVDNYKIDIVKNNIEKYYKTKNYAQCSYKGNLYTSCMNNIMSNIFEFYNEEPNISLLVLLDENGMLRARGLVYKNNKKEYYLDRVYFITYNDYNILYDYFLKNLGTQNYEDSNYDIDSYIKIYNDFNYYDTFPYIDTYKFYNVDDNTLNLSKDNIVNGLILNDRNLIHDTIGDVVITLDKKYDLVENCYKTKFGEWIRKKDAVQTDNGYEPKELCVKLSNGDWALEEDTIETYDNKIVLKSDTVTTVDDKIALESDCVRLNRWDWALESDCVLLANGKWNLEVNSYQHSDGKWYDEPEELESDN